MFKFQHDTLVVIFLNNNKMGGNLKEYVPQNRLKWQNRDFTRNLFLTIKLCRLLKWYYLVGNPIETVRPYSLLFYIPMVIPYGHCMEKGKLPLLFFCIF